MIRQYTKSGRMHQRTGSENQDHGAFLINDRYCFAVIADGATACRHSARGAVLACQAILNYANAHMDRLWQFSQDKIAYLLWEEVHAVLTREAQTLGHSPEDYASTLSFCCYDPSRHRLLLFQLGDSPIFLQFPGEGPNITWYPTFPPGGCPLTLTRDAYKAAKTLCIFVPEGGSLLLCTDGVPQACPRQILIAADPEALEKALDGADNPDDCTFLFMNFDDFRK